MGGEVRASLVVYKGQTPMADSLPLAGGGPSPPHPTPTHPLLHTRPNYAYIIKNCSQYATNCMHSAVYTLPRLSNKCGRAFVVIWHGAGFDPADRDGWGYIRGGGGISGPSVTDAGKTSMRSSWLLHGNVGQRAWLGQCVWLVTPLQYVQTRSTCTVRTCHQFAYVHHV